MALEAIVAMAIYLASILERVVDCCLVEHQLMAA